MLAKIRVFSVSLIFLGFLLNYLFGFSTNVFAVDSGCSASFPTCFLSTPADWSPGQCIAPSGSSCTLATGRSGAACCIANPTPTKKPVPNTQNECGTAQKNSSGQLVCRTGGGDIAIDTGFLAPDAWSWCGQVLVGNPCCSNQGGNGNTNCQQLAAEAAAAKQEKQATVDFDLCKQTGNDPKCTDCVANKGIWTAVGCVNTEYRGSNGIAATAIKLGLGIGGGVVLIMILAGAFKLTTSKGDPKATEEAKEMITNAIGGLLFILFSIVIVRTIGVGLLQIPGF